MTNCLSDSSMGNMSSPGKPPFTSGIYHEMYRKKVWTMRQYAGFSSAKETNSRFLSLLTNGQTGLSVAFDLPTQLGLDSDDDLSLGEVGKVGVAIDSIHDMKILFKDINLGEISTSMTINAPATTLLALYVALADEKGIPRKELRGTVQNDILKEYIARGLYIFPPEHSLRLTTDLMKWCNKNTPKWNTISISGYHLREAGCTASEELALTLTNALYYTRCAINSGLKIDEFAPRMSFFFGCHNNFFEEICKFRAARTLWYDIMSEFNPKNIKSSMLRFHTQTSGVTLTAQQPMVNAIRVAYQALSAVLGGTQSLHTNSFDEALGLPTEESATLALRTQQIIASEIGIIENIDPLTGSIMIENKTKNIMAEVRKIMSEIEDNGGSMNCIISGYQQKMIHESAWKHMKNVENKDIEVVGVNKYEENNKEDFEAQRLDINNTRKQIIHLQELKKNRNEDAIKIALQELSRVCKSEENIMDSIISAVKAEATVGEINNVMKDVFGTWISPSGV
ncbi:MAG: methylmalonyl-CoA mutase [Euryarchaeota archaeon]|nr:methylmalonyl-CoA mutase [Euryarchaeota archaeon]OUV26096.1 MAG: methylmalonyl-CoA mutase [Euryarchaeota archaeon TMED97]